MSLQRTCEVNYMTLMKLLPPGGSVGAERRYQVGNGLQFQLTVSEESRFTSQVILAQHNPELPSYLQARIEIRLYHDVRMAEVCAAQQISRLQPRYDYPNKNGYVPITCCMGRPSASCKQREIFTSSP
ncbi:DUF1249 domain-containing protein [Aeromonas hydrophila]|uniref:DUF1249 domain-containing protein n=1 Tax=Aeromonas hydrophila TaxID=644 RepID=UPI0036F4A3CC